MTTIAVVAMGEMGAALAQQLVARGVRVVTALAGRSAQSSARATEAGVVILSDAELTAEADIILSIVPPAVAAAIAARFLPGIAASPRKPTLIDCNAIAPKTLHALAQPYLERGLCIGDASIIGLPPRIDGYTPRIYMSGDIASEATELAGMGLQIRLLSPQLGDASGIKMAYAGITKGVQAIGTAMALGAARAGTAEAFVAELRDTQPQLYAWLAKMLPTMPRKAYRWDDEMREIATFLEPERGAADMLGGAAALYRHVAADNVSGTQSEIVTILDAFVANRN